MKVLIISILLMLGTITAQAQTQPTQPVVKPTPTAQSVNVSQSFLDDCTRAFTELVATRDALNKALAERGSSAELIKALNDSITVKGNIIASYEQLMAVQKQIIDLQQTVITNALNKLNAPKSAWQKFLTALKEVAYLASGILIGRAIP